MPDLSHTRPIMPFMERLTPVAVWDFATGTEIRVSTLKAS
jgi:hypothetical protein